MKYILTIFFATSGQRGRAIAHASKKFYLGSPYVEWSSKIMAEAEPTKQQKKNRKKKEAKIRKKQQQGEK